jgi:hypothetical protein
MAATAEDPVIDDILGSILGGLLGERLGRSRRAQLLLRLFWGLLGASLGAAGAVYVGMGGTGGGIHLRACAVALFVFLAAFSLFNVALARAWRWPGRLFVLSLVLLFVARIAFGP